MPPAGPPPAHLSELAVSAHARNTSRSDTKRDVDVMSHVSENTTEDIQSVLNTNKPQKRSRFEAFASTAVHDPDVLGSLVSKRIMSSITEVSIQVRENRTCVRADVDRTVEGARFCHNCRDTWTADYVPEDGKCPVCKTPLSFGLLRNKGVKRLSLIHI